MSGLSIIIINYHSVKDILNCLKSAWQSDSAKSFEWIIVNNCIEENDKATVVTSLYPQVKWINAGYNAGFARANNEGIKASSGDAVLLLNPDTIIKDDAIQTCYLRLKESDFVASSVQLKNEDGTDQISGNFFMKGGLNHLLPLPYLGNILRSIAFSFKVKKTNVISASRTEIVDWINGAFLMVKRSVIEKAALMDEDFFLFSEEIEWCSRIGKYGKMCVYGDLTTIHLQGTSINESTGQKEKGYFELTGKKGLQLIVSHHLRMRKQFGLFWFFIHLLTYTGEIPIFFIFSSLENLFTLRNPFKDWPDAWSYTVNIFKLWMLTPKIISSKPHFYKMY